MYTVFHTQHGTHGNDLSTSISFKIQHYDVRTQLLLITKSRKKTSMVDIRQKS